MQSRTVAVTIPAHNEGDHIAACLVALSRLKTDQRVRKLNISVLANNCHDATADIVTNFGAKNDHISVTRVTLPIEQANAGWARRLAFDTGLELLRDDGDVLFSTDADTCVSEDWLISTLDHLDEGYDAVAGFAWLNPAEVKFLPPTVRARFAAVRRYENALRVLKFKLGCDEPWPTHFYEGGASIAVTARAYRAIGGAPTPPVSEDKALFAALRAKAFRIRHARDVKVYTSCRFDGRAPGGAADTLAEWAVQSAEDPVWGVSRLDCVITGKQPMEPITFAELDRETARARSYVKQLRQTRPDKAITLLSKLTRDAGPICSESGAVKADPSSPTPPAGTPLSPFVA